MAPTNDVPSNSVPEAPPIVPVPAEAEANEGHPSLTHSTVPSDRDPSSPATVNPPYRPVRSFVLTYPARDVPEPSRTGPSSMEASTNENDNDVQPEPQSLPELPDAETRRLVTLYISDLRTRRPRTPNEKLYLAAAGALFRVSKVLVAETRWADKEWTRLYEQLKFDMQSRYNVDTSRLKAQIGRLRHELADMRRQRDAAVARDAAKELELAAKKDLLATTEDNANDLVPRIVALGHDGDVLGLAIAAVGIWFAMALALYRFVASTLGRSP